MMKAAALMSADQHRSMVVRRLEPSDLARIKIIASQTFGNHDWIVEAFQNHWFDPSSAGMYFPYCVEIDSVIASLVVLRMVNSHVGCLEALRVAVEFRSRGLAHIMVKAICDLARSSVPGLNKLRYCTYNKNHRSLAVATGQGFKVISEFPYVMLADHSQGDDVSFFTFPDVTIAAYRSRLVGACSAENALKSLKTTRAIDETHAALRRAGASIVIQDWKPYDVDEEDVKILFEDQSRAGHYAFISDLGVSLGKIRPDGLGFICLFEYYPFKQASLLSSEDDDQQAHAKLLDFCSHCVRWLDDLVKLGGDTVWFAYPWSLIKILKQRNLVAASEGENLNREVLLELNLNP